VAVFFFPSLKSFLSVPQSFHPTNRDTISQHTSHYVVRTPFSRIPPKARDLSPPPTPRFPVFGLTCSSPLSSSRNSQSHGPFMIPRFFSTSIPSDVFSFPSSVFYSSFDSGKERLFALPSTFFLRRPHMRVRLVRGLICFLSCANKGMPSPTLFGRPISAAAN